MDKPRLSFRDEISRNKRSSFFLIFVVMLTLLALVYSIAALFGGELFWVFIVVGIIISITYVVAGYYKSADLAVASVGAVKANQSQYREYHHLVEGLCLASGLPKPKLYVMNDPNINAFASGRDPKHAVVCVTTGAMEKLNKHELEGVLAHELSHIANYDIRFMTLTAVLVGMIAIISELFLRSLFWSSIAGGRRDNNNSNAVVMIIAIALAILAPLLVMLVQLAISRKREYAADSSAVLFTRSPTGLIGALKKIKGNGEMKVSGAVAPLFLGKTSRKKEWFSTHPPLADRIRKLERM